MVEFKKVAKSGVSYIVQPGGSILNEQAIKSCDELNMVMIFTNKRLFHH